MKNGSSPVYVRQAEETDLPQIAFLNGIAFAGNRASPEAANKWVRCWWEAFPLYQYFVAVEGKGKGARILGYIGWKIDGGFARDLPVLELEQIAVDPTLQNRGIARQLIEKSYPFAIEVVKQENPAAKNVRMIVWFYGDNKHAQKLYEGFFKEGEGGRRDQYGKEEVMYMVTLSL